MRKSLTIPLLGLRLRVLGPDTSSLDFYPELRGRLVRGDNHPIVSMRHRSPRALSLGKLSERFVRHELDETDERLLSRRVITDAGVAFLTQNWIDKTTDIANFNVHANGIGTTAEDVAQTGLISETGDRVAGVKSSPAPHQFRSIATLEQVATAAITEHGLFDAITTAGSTLWDRSVFSPINVQSGDSIEFTYTLSINSGG